MESTKETAAIDCKTRSIGFMLNTAARTYSHFLEVRMEELGVSMSHEQFSLMAELSRQDGISQQELACRAFRGKTSITRLLQGLEDKGFIERKACHSDKRIRHVFLTSEGREKLEILKMAADEASAKAVQNFDCDEAERLKVSLEKIFSNCINGPCE